MHPSFLAESFGRTSQASSWSDRMRFGKRQKSEEGAQRVEVVAPQLISQPLDFPDATVRASGDHHFLIESLRFQIALADYCSLLSDPEGL